jgi:hypothetical protein
MTKGRVRLLVEPMLLEHSMFFWMELLKQLSFGCLSSSQTYEHWMLFWMELLKQLGFGCLSLSWTYGYRSSVVQEGVLYPVYDQIAFLQ